LKSSFDITADAVESSVRAEIEQSRVRATQQLNVLFVVDTGDIAYDFDSLNRIVSISAATCSEKVRSYRHSIISLVNSSSTKPSSLESIAVLMHNYRDAMYPLEFCFLLEDRDEKGRPVSHNLFAAYMAYIVLLLNNEQLLSLTDLKSSTGSTGSRVCSLARCVIDTPIEKLYTTAAARSLSSILSRLRQDASSAKLPGPLLPTDITRWVKDHFRTTLSFESFPVFDDPLSLGAYGTLREVELDVFGDALNKRFRGDILNDEATWSKERSHYIETYKGQLRRLFDSSQYGLFYASTIIGQAENINGSVLNLFSEKIAHLELLKNTYEQAINQSYELLYAPEAMANARKMQRRSWCLSNRKDKMTIQQQVTLKGELKNKVYNKKLEIEKLNRQINLLSELKQLILNACSEQHRPIDTVEQACAALTQCANNSTSNDTSSVYTEEIDISLNNLVVDLLDSMWTTSFPEQIKRFASKEPVEAIEGYLKFFNETVWPDIYDKFSTLDNMLRYLSNSNLSKEYCMNKLYAAAEEDIAYPYLYADSCRPENSGMEVRFLVGDVDADLISYTRVYHPYIRRIELIKLRIGIDLDNLFIMSGAK
jgi:hypothetical protein